MNFKKLLLSILVLIFILNIGAVCASDNATDEIISSDATDEILSDQDIGDEILNIPNAADGENDTLTQSEDSSIMESTENTESVTDYGGLVSAVNNAKASSGTNYTINLEDGTYEYTSSIIWGGASSVKTLIINGNNQILDGKQKGPFITINNGYTLILNDMTISNFKTTGTGGAIYKISTSTLNTNNVIFKDNSARNGGAIWIGNGNTYLYNTTFISNSASAGGGALWLGLGNVIIEECNFIENIATGTSGAGAIYAGSTNSARIINSKFTNNKQTQREGGAIYNTMNPLYVENCIFTNNSASKGGAVYSETQITVEKSEFVENEARAEGGAIFMYGSNNANIIENTFMNDKAPAGAEISANKGLLEGNTIINSGADEAIKGTITQESNKIYDSEMTYLLDKIKELDDANAKIAELNSTLNQTLKDLDDANAKIAELNGTLNQTLVDLDDANAKIGELNGTLNQTLVDLDDANAKIGELNGTLNQTLVDLDAANKNISNLTNQIADAATQLANVIAQLEEVQKEIQNLSADLISTKITAKALTIQALNNGKFKITLTEGNNTLSNKTIYVYINGVTKQLTTNVNGTALLSVKFSKAGTYTPVITYMGDKTYSASVVTGKITVTKKATSITAPKSTFKVNQKTKKVKITLKSGKNVVAGKKITIKVNGKTFYAKTNSKGVATITVKLTKAGSFKYTAKFAGDGAYKAVSKNGYIKIKK